MVFLSPSLQKGGRALVLLRMLLQRKGWGLQAKEGGVGGFSALFSVLGQDTALLAAGHQERGGVSSTASLKLGFAPLISQEHPWLGKALKRPRA